MSAPAKAIFLSYASQDTAAARRIVDTLRAAGVEVWFDVEGGLETGDEWDAKIRRQIKECVLFIPIISANTQAREEGYFRIEWDLAAERARGIASGVPFILPIVIDDTREPEALVPDRFRSVQWTRARDGELTPELRAKFVQLWSHRAGLAKHKAALASVRAEAAEPELASAPARPSTKWVAVGGAALALAVAGGLYLKFADPSAAPGGGASTAASGARPSSTREESERLITQARALVYDPDSGRSEFSLAESLLKRALELSPDSARGWAVSALVNHYFTRRGFEREADRLTRSVADADRALRLSPEEPDALFALGLHRQLLGERDRAQAFLDRANRADPGNPRVLIALAGQKTTRREMGDAYAAAIPFTKQPAELYYYIALSRLFEGRFTEAREANQKALALHPFWRVHVQQANLEHLSTADPDRIDAALDQVPEAKRDEPRFAYMRYRAARLRNDGEAAVRALEAVAVDYFSDNFYTGPKSYLLAQAHELRGDATRARDAWRKAVQELDSGLRESPDSRFIRAALAHAEAAMGNTTRARELLAACAADERFSRTRVATEDAARAWLRLGEPAQALQMLVSSAQSDSSTGVSPAVLERDSEWAALRPLPGFAELLRTLRARDQAPSSNVGAASSGAGEKKPTTTGKVVSEGAQIAEQARALYNRFAYTREDLATAEELARRATELEPGLADAWGALAAVHGTYLQRGWDISEKRRNAAQQAATRATGLDPEQPDALFAQGYVLSRLGRGAQQTLELFRRAAASAPDNNRIARAYAGALSAAGRTEEARAVHEAVLRRDPQDPLAHYNLALNELSYGSGGVDDARLARCLHHLDAGIAAQPLATLLLFKATLVVGWRGDFETARAVLAELEKRPLSERTDDRAVVVPLWIATLERDSPRAATVAALTARSYFDDWTTVRRPKDWHLALARQGAGKANLAKLDWQRAEGVVREKLSLAPNEPQHLWELACTLAWLGRVDEARSLFAPIEAAWREEMSGQRAVQLTHYAAACGDGPKTAEYLRTAIDAHVTFTRHTLSRDPWLDRVRDHPDVQRLLTGPSGRL